MKLIPMITFLMLKLKWVFNLKKEIDTRGDYYSEGVSIIPSIPMLFIMKYII